MARVVLLFALLGLRLYPDAAPECPLCFVSGTCGCRQNVVLCCDGTVAYGCRC